MLGDEEVAELIVDLLPSGGKVLDVGCGGGHTLRALARRGVEGWGEYQGDDQGHIVRRTLD